MVNIRKNSKVINKSNKLNSRKKKSKKISKKSRRSRRNKKSRSKKRSRNDGGKYINEYKYIDIKTIPYKKRFKSTLPFKKRSRSIIDRFKFIPEKIDLILYRCLRTNELSDILKTGLLPPCTPCPDIGKCCIISPGAHINSGTKAKLKSRYISASQQESVGHWCSNNSGNPTRDKSATYVKFKVTYDKDTDYVLNPQTDISDIGIMAKNAAKASSEILIKDNVPSSNLLEIYRIKNITKTLFDSLPINFIANNMEFQKIIGKGKENKRTYHLSMKIWSSIKKINFDIVNGKWPE